MDRLRDLVPDLGLLEQSHDLFDAVGLDRVEHAVELLLRHHQLGEDALVKAHVVDKAVEHRVQRGAQLDASRRLAEERAELGHRDGQIGRHRALQRRDDGGRNLVDERVARGRGCWR